MNIIVIGDIRDKKECQAKFGEGHNYVVIQSPHEYPKSISAGDVCFDFRNYTNGGMGYNLPPVFPVFINAATVSVAKATAISSLDPQQTFGFAGLPGFISRDLVEVSIQSKSSEEKLRHVCEQLGTGFEVVEDRVGLITPRIICMIINEAFLAIEEDVASRQDIDVAMKLGTNYPFGPFEWCAQIGTRNVYQALEAIYRETGDKRYRPSSLLREESGYAGNKIE